LYCQFNHNNFNPMKKIFLFCMLVIMCLACNRVQVCKCGKCDNTGDPVPFASSLNIIEWPKTSFEDGIFKVDCIIESDEESNAFILLVLRQAKDGAIKGFGNDVKIDGYSVRSYHQLYSDPDSPTMDFPVFMKKIKAPEGTIRESINIHLPVGFKQCWGEIVVFRSSKAIEESMKTIIDPEMHKDTYNQMKYTQFGSFPLLEERIDKYYNFFPDSTLFSFLITSYRDLAIAYCENGGMKEVRGCLGVPMLWPKVGFSYFGARFFDENATTNYPFFEIYD